MEAPPGNRASPLLNGPGRASPREEDRASYEEAPRQALVDVLRVLMRKHFVLGLRRKRLTGTLFRAAIMVAIPLLIWNSAKGQESEEEVRPQLVTILCPLLGVLFMVTVFAQFAVEVVTDKELKMRYVQQVAGVSNTAYWASYYLYYFVLTSVASAIYLACLMGIAPIYKHSDGSLLYFLFWGSFLQAFFLSLMVSTVFARARMAGVVCGIFGSLVVGVSQAILPQISTTNGLVYFVESLIPFVSPLNLLHAVGTLEKQGQGFTWSSLNTPLDSINPTTGLRQLEPTAGTQCLILLADCLLYGLFAIWFDQVYQGEFGAAKPWDFCLRADFLCPQQRAGAPDPVDAEARTSQPALVLDGLVKVFGQHRAVDGMDLQVRRGEIFALLGHNGAGKTTAINCITGMLPMTAGSAQVCGVDVETNLQEARRHLSVCPQDNPLYNEFSVDEHLAFFAALRGVPTERARVSINDALEALGLVEKRAARVSTLSGGQKRRLWVATSLLGETPVVFLDEPTSGMDPANRRRLWDLLVQMKNRGRCILFTTHYLDEADVLAERKAILDRGKVRACGTSWDLKREFGLGYHLRVVCAGSADDAAQGRIGELLRSHVPSAVAESTPIEERPQGAGAPKQWSFVLPYSEVDRFGRMLQELEERAPSLRVQDYALETTTLEEVFMALGQGGDEAPGSQNEIGMTVTVEAPANTNVPMQVVHPGTGAQMEVQLPPGTQPGQAVQVLLPSSPTVPRSLGLASPAERQPVSWATAVQAVMALRLRQVIQKVRSLAATLLVPMGLMLVQTYFLSSGLKKINNLSETTRKQFLGVAGAGAGMWMSVSLAIALPHFATTLVIDRVQRCTYVATSQGLPSSAYWVGTFVNNYLHFLLLSLMVPICLLVFHAPFYSEAPQLMKILPAALWAPVPMLLFAYVASRFFSTAEGCSKFMPAITLLASVVPFLAVYIMTILSVSLQIGAISCDPPDSCAKTLSLGKTMHSWANSIHWAMSFADPFYCLPGAFAAIGLTCLTELDIPAEVGALDILFPSIGSSYVAVPLLGALALSLTLVLLLTWEARFCTAGFISRGSGPMTEAPAAGGEVEASYMPGNTGVTLQRQRSYTLDPDVAAEEQRLQGLPPAEPAVMYNRLVHTYGRGTRREVRAVRGISLAVARGECFCLLGPNGAGKTTTLDVLTGAICPPSAGEVVIAGHAVTGSVRARLAALRNLGNCPQVDPLWPSLTGRQHLLFYGRIKGLPRAVQASQAAALLRALGFSDFDADKPTQGYSGGMKRKLSLAIALIGSPPTLLLDEPSAAVDAAAKRHLWQVVKQRGQGQTVILTTHSMEEAEALSDRLAIQVRGRLRCLGTPDHIKNTHGAGYQLELVTRSANEIGVAAGADPDPAVENFLVALCPTAQLLEYHEGRYLFQLPVLKAVGAGAGELSVAALFLHMQDAKQAIGVQDYSISRPSLEQVFLRFSREQEELESAAA